MKSFITLSFALFSSALLAMPSVGDMATYKVRTNGYEGTLKIELTSFDASTNSFTKKETTSFMGQETSEVETVNASELQSESQLQMALAYCSNMGGTLETVSVPAGNFQTCALQNAEGKANIGVVPFALVKFSNATANLELISFKLGK
jgi:hypothetical protein